MTVEQMIPHLLEQINVAKWGQRRADMLRLAAQRSIPGYLVVITPALIAQYGERNLRQARYDHGVLVELTSEHWRVLHRRRGPGGKSDAFEVRHPAAWRHIPWLVSQKDALRRLRAWERATALAATTGGPGQSMFPVPGRPLNGECGESSLSAKHLSQPPTHLSQPPKVERGGGSPPGSAAKGGSPPLHASNSVNSLPHYLPHNGEGVSECVEADPDPGTELLSAVAATVKTPVFSGPADRIRAVGRAHPDRLDELISFAFGLGWVVTATGAAQAVEERARALITRPLRHSVASERSYLQRMLEQEIAIDGDQERIEELHARLAVIGVS